jgi:hypothetical protein
VVDANFGGTTRFALAGEGSRPVFVTPAAIDPASGAVSAAEARRSTEYGRVGVRTGDLRGYGGQLTVTVQPDVFKFRSRRQLFGSVGLHAAGDAAAVPRLRRRGVRRPVAARVGGRPRTTRGTRSS